MTYTVEQQKILSDALLQGLETWMMEVDQFPHERVIVSSAIEVMKHYAKGI